MQRQRWKYLVMSMMLKHLLIPLLLIPALANAADATFTWSPNTESHLLGYVISRGVSPHTYTMHYEKICGPSMDSCTQITINGLVKNKDYYFAAKAVGHYDNTLVYSSYCPEIKVNITGDK